MRSKTSGDSVYPHTPLDWRKWITRNLDIDEIYGVELVENEIFPLQQLEETWKREFTHERGYSPDFIPALIRNMNGFLKWVYSGGSEPNWMRSD